MVFETLITTYDENDNMICAAIAESAQQPTENYILDLLSLVASDANWAVVSTHVSGSTEVLDVWKVEVTHGEKT